MADPIIAKTKHGEITLDRIAEIQPGTARIMDEVGRRMWYLYYSAKGGNWKLALHNVNEINALFDILESIRPRYSQDLRQFQTACFVPMKSAILAKSWGQFEKEYAAAMKLSDEYHKKYGYTYVRFVLPSSAPEHLYLGDTEQQ